MGDLQEGLRHISIKLQAWKKGTITARRAPSKFVSICAALKKHLPNVGPLQSQHIANVLIRIGVIPFPVLASQAFIAPTTYTFKRIITILQENNKFGWDYKHCLMLLRDDTNRLQLLRALASEVKLDLVVPEHLLCKLLTKDSQSKQKSRAVSKTDVIIIVLPFIQRRSKMNGTSKSFYFNAVSITTNKKEEYEDGNKQGNDSNL